MWTPKKASTGHNDTLRVRASGHQCVERRRPRANIGARSATRRYAKALTPNPRLVVFWTKAIGCGRNGSPQATSAIRFAPNARVAAVCCTEDNILDCDSEPAAPTQCGRQFASGASLPTRPSSCSFMWSQRALAHSIMKAQTTEAMHHCQPHRSPQATVEARELLC